MVCAGIGFTALIAACFVIARYFTSQQRRGMAGYSRVTGVVFLAAFAGVTSGSAASAAVVPFYAAVLAVFTWIAVLAVHLYRRAANHTSL